MRAETSPAARAGTAIRERILRDIRSALASGEVHGTPTLFIDGELHRAGHDPDSLRDALT